MENKEKGFMEKVKDKEYSKALECFEDKMKKVELENKQFIADNNINFKLSYYIYTAYGEVTFKVTDEKIQNYIGSAMHQAFKDCFSDI